MCTQVAEIPSDANIFPAITIQLLGFNISHLFLLLHATFLLHTFPRMQIQLIFAFSVNFGAKKCCLRDFFWSAL